jgi:hypothetical protein
MVFFLTLSDLQSMVARHASSVAFSPSFLQVIDANTRDSCMRKRMTLINILFAVLSLPSVRSLELYVYALRCTITHTRSAWCHTWMVARQIRMWRIE